MEEEEEMTAFAKQMRISDNEQNATGRRPGRLELSVVAILLMMI